MSVKEEPKACPGCGAAPEVLRVSSSKWKVVCSKSSYLPGTPCPAGHTMFTRRKAVEVWNKLA